MEKLNEITREDVVAAAKEADNNPEQWLHDITKARKAKTTYVTVGNKNYPAKALGYRAGQIRAKNDKKYFDLHTHTVARALAKLNFVITDKSRTKADERQRNTIEVLARDNQPNFRKIALALYENKCAITGCKVQSALEAAHVHPYSEGGSDEASNCIVLRADLHRLFDTAELAIDPQTLKTVFAKDAVRHYSKYNDKKVSLPDGGPTQKSLIQRWREFSGNNEIA